jgi:hypothetical protein
MKQQYCIYMLSSRASGNDDSVAEALEATESPPFFPFDASAIRIKLQSS